jgi:hypothetical protein
VIDHLVETRHAIGQRLLAILVEEELGVGQTRAHDALVALDDGARVGRTDVADDEELVGQLGRSVEQREILLVGLHRQDEAFLRHGEEVLLELAGQHVGAFDEAADLVQQRVVVDGRQALLCRGLGQLAHDLGATLGEAGDDRAFVAQLRGVAVGVADRDGRGLRLETMALRDAVGAQAQRGDGHDIVAVQRDEAMRGTHELDVAPAVGELVAHHLGDRQLGERLVDRLLQAFGQRGAGDHLVDEQALGLAVRLALQAGHGVGAEAQRGQLLQQRGRRVAVLVERDGRGHQLLQQRAIGGLGGDALDVHPEPAR